MKRHLSNRHKRNNKTLTRGFTLLEVILAISIMSILIGSIFTITNSSVLLSQTIVDSQATHRHQKNLGHYLESIFTNLPQDARITLVEDASGQQVLTIDNPNTFFPYLQKDHFAYHIQTSTSKNRNGLLDFSIAYKWEIYSVRDQLWDTTWSLDQGSPSHIRLSYNTASQQEQIIKTFWIPPAILGISNR